MKKMFALLTASLLAVALLAGCVSSGTSTPAPASTAPAESTVPASEAPAESTAPSAEGGQYKFAFTEMSAGSFFDACFQGLTSVTEPHGDEVIHVEGKADANHQLGVVEDFIAQDVDLIFYCPSDAAASAPAMQAMAEAGIPIVGFDSPPSNPELLTSYVAVDAYSAGDIAGQELVANHPEGGKIAILDFPASDAATQRTEGFKAAIEGQGFEIVAQMDAGAKPETGLAIMNDLLQAHPDLTAVFCINDECAQGAYSAITATGESVEIYSVNGGPEAKAAMKKDGVDGIWKCSAAQSPIKVGEAAGEVAYKILNGEDYEKEILIPSFAITPENIDEYGDQEWQ